MDARIPNQNDGCFDFATGRVTETGALIELVEPAREQTNSEVLERVALAEHALAQKLPSLNASMRSGGASVRDAALQLGSILAPLLEIEVRVLAGLDTASARWAQKLLGFAACSIERTAQEMGFAPGVGLRMIAGAEDAMTALSISTQMPPNLSLHGYWTDNVKGQVVSFSGSAGETSFRNAVAFVCCRNAEAASRVKKTLVASNSVADPSFAESLLLAARTQLEVKAKYRELRNTGKTGELALTVEEFNEMRRYLVTFPVNGVTWHGPNAANILEQSLLDLLVGIVNPDYIKVIQERSRYMTPEERGQILDALRHSSVVDRILDGLGLDEESAIAIDVDDLANLLRSKPELRETMQAFAMFKEAAAAASGAHFFLISEFLVRSLEGKDSKNGGIRSTHGVGGRNHDDTKQIMFMRRDHAVAAKLCRATKAAFARKERLCLPRRSRTLASFVD